MIPCLSEATTMPAHFDEDVRAFASAGCTHMEVWCTKLEEYVGTHSVDAARRLADEQGVRLAVAAALGGLLLAQGEQRRESFTLFEQRLELCQSLQIPVLIIIADSAATDATGYERALVSLKQAAGQARDRGVRLALEFQARSGFCNNLSTAIGLVTACAEPNVGVCLDLFHYYCGPSKFEDLVGLSPELLFHVQLSDLAGVPRELASDSDRILPGDGEFQLAPIVDQLRRIGYAGCVSVELMNPRIWQVPAAQVAEVSLTALRKLLGLTAA